MKPIVYALAGMLLLPPNHSAAQSIRQAGLHLAWVGETSDEIGGFVEMELSGVTVELLARTTHRTTTFEAGVKNTLQQIAVGYEFGESGIALGVGGASLSQSHRLGITGRSLDQHLLDQVGNKRSLFVWTEHRNEYFSTSDYPVHLRFRTGLWRTGLGTLGSRVAPFHQGEVGVRLGSSDTVAFAGWHSRGNGISESEWTVGWSWVRSR